MFGPVIEGERVRLEPPRPGHSPVYLGWLADMEVTRYISGQWHDIWLAEIHREDWERAREAACTAR